MTETGGTRAKEGMGKGSIERLGSVDALRGFDMFWILGADGLFQALTRLGDSPILKTVRSQLEHKEWEGFAFYDLIFPLFIFLAGMSVVFSLSRIVDEQGRLAAYKRIFRRTLIIYFLGVFFYDGLAKPWPEVRLLGVLQRIAICYFFTGILFCHLRWRGLLAACIAILLGYWALMALVPVPGVGAGCFDPERNLANYIDAKYLPGWKWENKTWDPEGLISTLPAVGTCLIGALMGLFMRNASVSPSRKVKYLILGGAAMVVLGFAWGTQFPVIKKIWTSSYVLVAGGYSCICLGTFYLVIDILKIRRWAQPFVWIGMNPLTLYMASDVIDFEKMARRIAGGSVQELLGPYGELVLYVIGLGLIFCLARFLYTRKIFLRA